MSVATEHSGETILASTARVFLSGTQLSSRRTLRRSCSAHRQLVPRESNISTRKGSRFQPLSEISARSRLEGRFSLRFDFANAIELYTTSIVSVFFYNTSCRIPKGYLIVLGAAVWKYTNPAKLHFSQSGAPPRSGCLIVEELLVINDRLAIRFLQCYAHVKKKDNVVIDY